MFTFRLATLLPLCAFALFLSILPGCKKDFLETSSPQSTVQSPTSINRGEGITKEEVRSWFTSQYGVKKHVSTEFGENELEFDIKPVWAFSSEGIYGISTPIVIAPVERITALDFENRTAYFLLFYKDSLNIIQAELVFCFGDASYLNWAYPKTPQDFSGLVLKMDLEGVFRQRVSIMRDGITITDALIDPSSPVIIWANEEAIIKDFIGDGYWSGITGEVPAGGSGNPPWWWPFPKKDLCPSPNNKKGWFESLWGEITGFFGGNGNGNGGNGSGNGSGNGGPGVTWINTIWSPWGPLGGFDGNGGAGGGGGGTGTTNTGNVLEHYHFLSLYTNPMFQISEYFENMGLEGEAYQIFGFLNTDGRQFLANEPGFIDIFYDFLTANGNSTDARNFVSDIIALMLQTNNTDFTLEELNFIFENLPGIGVAATPPNNTPISVGQLVCTEIFNFQNYENEVTHEDLAAMVLSNSYFQFNVPGGQPFVLFAQRLNFEAFANSNSNCLASCPAAAANSINIAVAKVQQFVNNQTAGTPGLPELARITLLQNLDREFLNQVKSCDPGYTTNVSFVSEITSLYPGVSIVDCDAQIVICQ